MTDRQKPHLIWIAVVALGAAALAGVAWWLWSTPASERSGGMEDPASRSGAGPGAGPATGAPSGSSDDQRDRINAALEAAATAVEADEFALAASLLDAAEQHFGWSDAIGELSSRLALHEETFRAALRPIEFRVESFESERDGLFARFRVEGTTVFATEPLARSFGHAGAERRANLVTLRTSLYAGASLEIVESGGIFGGDEVVLGAVPLAPLSEVGGGQMEFDDADAAVRQLVVRYRPSPFRPGVDVDDPVPLPPPDASARAVVDAATQAIARDDLDGARAALERLRAAHATHADIEFLDDRIRSRAESLKRNRTTARFVVLEASADPKGGDTPWANGGSAPSFRCSIQSDSRTICRTEGGPTAPYLVPEDSLDPPPGNVLSVTARGDEALTFVLTDTSPTFGSVRVGSVELPVALGSLPRGSGLLVVEREPAVLVLPASESNRLRRIVLRWTVDR